MWLLFILPTQLNRSVLNSTLIKIIFLSFHKKGGKIGPNPRTSAPRTFRPRPRATPRPTNDPETSSLAPQSCEIQFDEVIRGKLAFLIKRISNILFLFNDALKHILIKLYLRLCVGNLLKKTIPYSPPPTPQKKKEKKKKEKKEYKNHKKLF